MEFKARRGQDCALPFSVGVRAYILASRDYFPRSNHPDLLKGLRDILDTLRLMFIMWLCFFG